MSTPDFLDSMETLPTRETVAELKPDPATEVEETEEEDEEQEEAPQETEQASEQVDKPAATTAAHESKEAAGLKAGIAAERKKRQELEAKLRALEARSAPAREAKAPVNFYENPEQYVMDAVQTVQLAHLNALQADMREQHEDFDEVAALVVEAAETNPQLQARVMSAGNPAREIYRVGKELIEAQKQAELMKDPGAYKASIRDELKAELLAELRAELGEPAKPKVTLPRDLSNGRSGADQVAVTPPSDPRRGGFEDLFNNRPRQT